MAGFPQHLHRLDRIGDALVIGDHLVLRPVARGRQVVAKAGEVERLRHAGLGEADPVGGDLTVRPVQPDIAGERLEIRRHRLEGMDRAVMLAGLKREQAEQPDMRPRIDDYVARPEIDGGVLVLVGADDIGDHHPGFVGVDVVEVADAGEGAALGGGGR